MISFLIFLCALSLFSTDIFLPVLPTINEYYCISAGDSQLIISIYFFGLALSQLISGSFSDHFGRRVTLRFALVFYTLGSIVCMLSLSFPFLLMGRFIQAFGAGAIVVLWRAIVIDLFDKVESIKIIATVSPAIMISPAIAPVIGGSLSSILGWRSTFGFLIVLGLLGFILATFYLRETNQTFPTHKYNFISSIQKFINLLKCKDLFCYLILVCLAYGSYFAFLADSPFFFKQLNYGTIEMSFFYIPVAIAFLLGNIITKKLLILLHNNQLLMIGNIFFVVGGIVIAALTANNIMNLSLIFGSFLLLVLGNGILLTVGVAKALSLFPEIAGTASGLVSFFQSITAFVMTWMVAYLNNNGFSHLSLALPLMLAVILIMGLVMHVNKRERILNGLNYVE